MRAEGGHTNERNQRDEGATTNGSTTSPAERADHEERETRLHSNHVRTFLSSVIKLDLEIMIGGLKESRTNAAAYPMRQPSWGMHKVNAHKTTSGTQRRTIHTLKGGGLTSSSLTRCLVACNSAVSFGRLMAFRLNLRASARAASCIGR